jgi:phosphoenolpyruvate synthase/pyruvate phosphate dikinase
LTKHKLSDELKKDFEVLRLFGAYIDERKNTMMRITCAIWHCMKAFERVTGVPMDELEWYTYKELASLVKDSARVDSEIVRSRAKLSVFMTTWEDNAIKEVVFIDKEAEELLALLNNYDSKEISGTVASWPDNLGEKFVGTAQIVFHPAKETLEKGNILVTTMTRPDFIPLIKSASAIITDEGGITCHAAIVSREFGIPCIIGTKKATKVLKSGDKIELNRSGIVRHCEEAGRMTGRRGNPGGQTPNHKIYD